LLLRTIPNHSDRNLNHKHKYDKGENQSPKSAQVGFDYLG